MMRFALILGILFGLLHESQAQVGVYSASGSWVHVKIKAKTPGTATNRSFTEDFSDNRNRWLIGRRGAYAFDMSQNTYRIYKQASDSPASAFSYISIPTALNLNKVDTFMVQVELAGPSGIIPDAGLLIGVKDSLNYCHFRINNKNQVSVKYVINGLSYTIYMRGDYVPAGIPLSATKNTLTVRRKGEQIHFYLNGREIPTSPYQFRQYQGNGIGFVSTTDGTTFRNLTVSVGTTSR
ncbi:hypothetical protein GCM10028803_43940 [Larkinella knui]|uniref:DUF1080 domain-containing protein n=1 Tax=Larkinella knui TaxID=2025310 RepID=A0A3P1CP83_9BACT|nr:hypothetical protein [Larkinella knui]RRB15010.1 hypothetical protein EHT87_10655 [Larkinella knui]